MLDICLLGTGGMMPLPKRWLTALMARYNGNSILIDCGEGTQIAIKQKGLSVNPINVICFTHYHADHISGLPGLLLSMGNSQRTEAVTMIGPKGLERVVNSLRCIAPELPFPINYIELNEDKMTIPFDGYTIETVKVNHNITCYAYNIVIDRKGKFDLEKAKALDIPREYWSKLQNGENILFNGNEYTSDMVMGSQRKGLKVTYCTDSRPMKQIADMAYKADLFVCEGMYGENDKEAKAKENKHMTFSEAAKLAKQAEVKQMWLTHYSPSLIRPDEYIDEAKEIFENSSICKDGRSIDLLFED